MLNASGTYLIDRYSTKDQPRIINLVDTKNFKETANLLTQGAYGRGHVYVR